MALQGGQLLIVRQRITLEPGENAIDTGIRETLRSYDPGIDGVEPTIDDPGIPSRVMVLPQAPLTEWLGITHTEPHLNVGGTVEVVFTNPGDAVTVNVLFWDPHTLVAPVSADTYNEFTPVPPEVAVLPLVEMFVGDTVGNGGA